MEKLATVVILVPGFVAMIALGGYAQIGHIVASYMTHLQALMTLIK